MPYVSRRSYRRPAQPSYRRRRVVARVVRRRPVRRRPTVRRRRR